MRSYYILLMSFFLIFSLVISFFNASNTVYAQEPFAFQTMVGMKYQQNLQIRNGDMVDRDYDQFSVQFNHNLDQTSVTGATVTLKDGQGLEVPVALSSWGNQLLFSSNSVLKRNETYTLLIKGGPNGVKDRDGNSLSSDVKLTFQTKNVSIKMSYNLSVIFMQPQISMYRIYAEQGPITLKSPTKMHVLIEDPYEGKVLFETDLLDQPKEFLLPKTGEYNLYFYAKPEDPFLNGKGELSTGVFVEALELKVPDEYTPLVTHRYFNRFEILNDPFDLKIGFPHEPVKHLEILLDDKQVTTLTGGTLLKPGGIGPIVIDPTKLKDGFHTLTIIAERPNSMNQSIFFRHFLVDREDTFQDVTHSHWSHQAVELMNHLGILMGRSNNQFVPDQPVTREEFATMIAKTLGLKSTGKQTIAFEDSSSDWAKPHIDALAEAGLINGEIVNGKRYFNPKRTITRAEASAIIGNALKISNIDISGAQAPFKDFGQVPGWAKPSVLVLFHEKWVNGYPDGTFRPYNTLTRAEAAQILRKFIGE